MFYVYDLLDILLTDWFFDGMGWVIETTIKKHFLIRLPIFSILWILWLILLPVYYIVYICIVRDLDLGIDMVLIYAYCLMMFPVVIIYSYRIDVNDEQRQWIKENLKKGTYVPLFDEMYFKNLEDVMAFKLKWL